MQVVHEHSGGNDDGLVHQPPDGHITSFVQLSKLFREQYSPTHFL